MDTMNTMNEFLTALASKEPVPGGGGVSALIGSLSAALCSMAANLTSGKKKYAEYQPDIERIIDEAGKSIERLYALIAKDAQAFLPLSKAYSLPKDAPDRDAILENALTQACSVPMEILREAYALVALTEELSVKGSRLAVSDVGVAATACRSAMEGAVMNVFINTKLMKDRKTAAEINNEASLLLNDGTERCAAVYKIVTEELRCGNE